MHAYATALILALTASAAQAQATDPVTSAALLPTWKGSVSQIIASKP